MFEKIVYGQLHEYLNSYHLLNPCQSGFRSLHGTLTTALPEAANSWSVNIMTVRKSIWVSLSASLAHALKEHQKAVSTLNKGKSALAEHVCDTKHAIAWENSKIITTNNRYGQRRCLEAWHINMNQHALNRDDGSYLPQEYLHLVGK